MPSVLVRPVLDSRVPKLCFRPYEDHPRGCPNYNKKDGCPPGVCGLGRVLNLEEPVWAVYNKFDLAAHVERMQKKHPDWSQRQLHCCLYWQPTARKLLRREQERFLDGDGEGYCTVRCPEAHGVDLTATMHNVGIELEWPPRQWAYQIVLIGYPRVRRRKL